MIANFKKTKHIFGDVGRALWESLHMQVVFGYASSKLDPRIDRRGRDAESPRAAGFRQGRRLTMCIDIEQPRTKAKEAKPECVTAAETGPVSYSTRNQPHSRISEEGLPHNRTRRRTTCTRHPIVTSRPLRRRCRTKGIVRSTLRRHHLHRE